MEREDSRDPVAFCSRLQVDLGQQVGWLLRTGATRLSDEAAMQPHAVAAAAGDARKALRQAAGFCLHVDESGAGPGAGSGRPPLPPHPWAPAAAAAAARLSCPVRAQLLDSCRDPSRAAVVLRRGLHGRLGRPWGGGRVLARGILRAVRALSAARARIAN